MKRLSWWAVFLFLAAVCAAQAPPLDEKKPASATSQPTSRPAVSPLRVDVKARTVTLDAEVVNAQYPLEFLLCVKGTKDYESVLATRVPPSRVHAALLMLGLTNGKPGRWYGWGETAQFLPPRGPELKISLRWTDKEGKTHTADADQWLVSAANQKAKVPQKWVFVGSDVLPNGKYWADLPSESGIISVANLPSAVIDVPFHSAQPLEQRQFRPNTKVIPPVGTAVEVVLAPLKGAENAEHARALLEIDRFGRLRLEGKAITPDQLGPWASKFLERHAKAQVVIRADGRALVWDVMLARDELFLVGLHDVDEQPLWPNGFVLPRTSTEAARSVDWWARELRDPQELFQPQQEAEALLKQIDVELSELQSRQAMLREYKMHLKDTLEKYKASTQPASP